MTYVGVTTAVVAFAGLEPLAEFDDDEGDLRDLGDEVLGSPWDKIVVLAIVISADLVDADDDHPGVSRTTFSMGRAGAFPARFASVHPRFRTPPSRRSSWPR